MTRAELERLDRDTLIARAEDAGVTRARILTRPELVDELLQRSAAAGDRKASRARGFFGRARDLLTRVMERGLHLPDAAEKLRSLVMDPVPAPRSASAVLPTVTLAEIYAAQGHRERAKDTLRGVLAREPEHAAARAFLAQLEDPTHTVPAPMMLPEEDEASAPEPPLEPAPHDEPRDECVAIPLDPETLFVRWEAKGTTVDTLRRLRAAGALSVRVIAIRPTWDGPETDVCDVDVAAAIGDATVTELPAGSVVRAALGWRDGDAFFPIAHSPALETSDDALVRWTGSAAIPIMESDPDAAAIQRALDSARPAGQRTLP